MSTRKLSGRLNTNSPTSTISSTDSSNTTASLTVSQSPTKSSPLSLSPTSLSAKSTIDNSINSNQITDTKKRRRRTSVLASPSLLSSSSSPSKKVDENDETLSSVSDAIADDDKSLKTVNDEEIKDEKDNKEKETSSESPARSRRRKLYENKTATTSMVTRKTTMDSVRNTRSLRCIRRDSQGKLEGFFEICPPKRPYRRKTNSTPELSTPTKRKKDEISGKDEDESEMLQKKIKIEKNDTEDEIEKIEDEEFMKEEDEMDKTYLDETVKTEGVDSTIVGEIDTGDVATSLQDSALHEDASEAASEEQQEEKVSKENEQSTEIVTEEKTVPAVVPVKVGTTRGRPPRNKQKLMEVKPVPAKKGRKPKAPVIRKIQPTRSVTKKGKESVRSAVNATKAEELEETKEEEEEVSGVEEPLSVDTNVTTTPVEKESLSNASCSGGETSEKAASLSPDLMSEGVNVQSVKDFYKKPEFLENNRGIEKDPKLGEIVQEVEQKIGDDDDEEETEKIPLQIEEEEVEEETITGFENDTSVVEETKDNEGQNKNNENGIQENSEKTEIITEDDVDKEKILEDNSQQSTDMDLFSLKNLNESDRNDTYGVERDEGEISGSGDSLKDNEILLVLEDSNDEEGINSNINEKLAVTATEVDIEKEKEKESQDELKISNESSVSESNEDILTKTQEIKITSATSAIKEKVGESEVDLRPICDKINSNNSSTSNSNCSNINSNNDNKAVDENEEVAVDDDMAIKDNKVDDDIDDRKLEIDKKTDHESKKIVNENINSQMKAIKKQGEEGETELLKDEEKIKIKDQLNLQMEVDSGISDAVTDTNEDVNMHEINQEIKNECLEIIDVDNKCDELKAKLATINATEGPSTSTGLGASKKPSKKLKEERDSKKVEKFESELPLLQSKLQETPETLKQKENHLKSLGLLTHKAAVEAKIEKQRRRKQLQSNLISSLTSKKSGNGSSSSSSSSSSSNGSNSSIASNGSNGGSNGFNSGGGICNKSAGEEYTGTLKTVIKLNRQGNTVNTVNETKRKSIGNGSNGGNGNGNGSNGNSNGGNSSSSGTEGRQSLKMTFQKGRGRPPNSLKDAKDFAHSTEETYYTIQNENEGSQQHNSVSHGRKSYNRSHTTTVDMNHHTSSTSTITATTATVTTTITTTTTTAVAAVTATTSSSETQEPLSDKVEENKLILIPEKASSFGIHPGRLCQDQCFYCGGRFGLYDTPCHVAQLKSDERKQKILANEEKLTIDNCLCDACFRHVVRRAKDSPSSTNYKPRISAPATLETPATVTASANNATAPSTDDSAEVIVQDEVAIIDDTQPTTYWATSTNKPNCFVPDCKNQSSHSLRRKCIRKTIKKLVPNFDLSKIGATAPICEKHYNTVIQFLGCALCKRRLGKNHMQYINQDSEKLGKLLAEQGIPVKLANNSAVCKLCRYFVNLLLKPPDHGKLQKEQFVKNYRRRLLHFHNIQSGETSDIEDQSSPPENKTDTETSKEKPVVEEQVTITKPKRGRKPKNQAVAAAVAAAIAKASAAVATATATATAAATTTTTATSSAPTHLRHKQSSESEKSCSNIGTGSNTPQSSDDGNDKLLQPIAAVSSNCPVSGQIILDNDVMVDYDMPVPLDTPSPPPVDPPPPPPPPPPSTASSSQQQSSITSKLQSILQSGGTGGRGSLSASSSSSSTPKEDISIVLRSNPNISMRELFPGEEEMGLHMNVPFGNSQSYRTPEGWTRVQTFLQYDDPTRRLWENLQKPYGNQSSFLRHLILLEKYFRNGDLVLSHKASENATVYSETVRNRLRSYDNVVVDDSSSGSNNINNDDSDIVDITKSLLDKIPKHVSNLPITITTKPKQQSQNVSNSSNNNNSGGSGNDGISSNRKSSISGASAGDSILKSNLLGKKSDSIEILPISSDSSGGAGNRSSGMTKQQKLLAAASKLIGNGGGGGNVGEGSSSLMSQQQQKQQQQQQQSPSQQKLQPEPKKSMINNGINLPPQLISINRGQNNVNNVNDNSSNSMLSNRRRSTSDHHSTTHRRNSKQIPPNVIVLPDTLTPAERLQSKNWRPTLMPVSQAAHLRQPGGPLYQTADGRRLPALVQVQSGGNPYLISIHDYNRMCILRREKIMREQLMKNRNLNQQLTQHSKSQFMGGRHSDPTTSSGGMGGGSLSSRNSQHSLKTPPQQTSLLKNSLSSGPSPSGSGMASLASKLLGPSPSQLQILPQMPSTSQHQMNSSSSSANSVSIIPSSLGGIVGGGGPLLPPSTVATNVSTSWLWNNINGGPPNSILNKNILSFTANPSPSTSSSSISPLKQQQQQQQMQLQSMNNAPPLILDNNLLSKIPKSLTVIPQQKPQGRRHSRGCSIDDLTSA